jgi:hypothetical protein
MNYTIIEQTSTPREAIEKFIRVYATDMNGSLQTIVTEINQAKRENDLTRQAGRLLAVREIIHSMKTKLELMRSNILSLNENNSK